MQLFASPLSTSLFISNGTMFIVVHITYLKMITTKMFQTSSKSAVETTELTRSFGWDSSEAWQQHDIQELCRVMFDALEQKFKDTDQADLIQRLYEGKIVAVFGLYSAVCFIAPSFTQVCFQK